MANDKISDIINGIVQDVEQMCRERQDLNVCPGSIRVCIGRSANQYEWVTWVEGKISTTDKVVALCFHSSVTPAMYKMRHALLELRHDIDCTLCKQLSIVELY